MSYETFKDLMTRNSSKPRLIVSDLDEVLVDISPKWTYMLSQKYPKVFEALKKSGKTIQEIAHEREHYWMEKFINETLGVDLTTEDIVLPFVNDNTFYDDLELTKCGKAYKFLSENSKLNTRLVILTHFPQTLAANIDKSAQSSKIAFVKTRLPNATLLNLDLSVCKATAINDNKLDYDIFLDDRLDIVESVIDKTSSTGKEFQIPKLGYNNQLSPALQEKIQKLMIRLFYYEARNK